MKSMFLNIDTRNGILFLLLFFVAPILFSQEKQQIAPIDEKDHVMFSFGVVKPFPFGKNIVNEAYAVSMGGEFRVWARIFDEIWIGSEISVFGADVEKKELTGNYNEVTIFSSSLAVGYKFHLKNNFGLLTGIGVGNVKYKNHHSEYEFHDDGTVFWLTADLNYGLTDHFGFYLSGKFRRDFLKTEAQGLEKHYFDNNYMLVSVGILVKI